MRPSFVALCLALFAAGCDQVIDYIEIEPSQVNLTRRGEGLWLRAKPMSRNGKYYPRLPVAWSCDNAKVVAIDGAGRLTGVGPGQTVCTAKVGSKTATVDVDVNTVESVKITPTTVTLTEDDEPFRPQITPLDEKGRELRGRALDMKSKDENVANVDGEKIYPVAVGHTTVVVRADDREAVVDVTVTKGKKHR